MKRLLRRGCQTRIEAEISRDYINIAVLVEVADYQAVPKTVGPVQPKICRFIFQFSVCQF